MVEMVRVLKPERWIAIYDEPSTVFYCVKLLRQKGLQIEKKTLGMVFWGKNPLSKSKKLTLSKILLANMLLKKVIVNEKGQNETYIRSRSNLSNQSPRRNKQKLAWLG
jgi:hypothetical protein